MKTLNLTVAIIYTIILGLFALSGLLEGDTNLVIGAVFLSGPLIVNWITYKNID